jgi:hypothetical protein
LTRDGGQCAFVGTEGRCTARGFLELHHVAPFALGGRQPTLDLLRRVWVNVPERHRGQLRGVLPARAILE